MKKNHDDEWMNFPSHSNDDIIPSENSFTIFHHTYKTCECETFFLEN